MEIFCSVWCRQNNVECVIRNENIRDQRWSSRDLQLKIDTKGTTVSAFWFLVYQYIGCRSGPSLYERKKVFAGWKGHPSTWAIHGCNNFSFLSLCELKDVSPRRRTNIRELTTPCAHVSQRIPLSRKTPFSCARRWDGKRELWDNYFSTLRKCEKGCRIKELAWFDIRRKSQRVEIYQQRIRRN